ncbi:MAG TPA: glycoside hydrolase family 19 protein [Stellaceae bacterium]|nr:glycoside hydrolase family 19 protein [Terriglobia bacterium]HEV2551781.1 glycoside hydrolase family 19 protein [Stellaceae bacterium]
MITPMQLRAVFPYCRNPGLWCRTFDQVVDEFELRPPHRLAMWLAQCGFESESFNRLREDLSYRTPAQLRAVFPREFPTDDAAQRYVMNPAGLGNFIYAGRNGNGNAASGDGFKYRGGGLIQLTGRGNYKGVGEALGLDLEVRPLQITSEPIAARTAGFFWKQNDLNAAADAGDFDYTTRRVNGPAMEGAAERKALWQKLVVQLDVPTPVAAAAIARRAATVPVMDGVMTPGMNGT